VKQSAAMARRTAPRRTHCIVAATVAALLLLKTLGDAFVVTGPATSVTSNLGARLANSPVAATAATPWMAESSASFMSVAAAGALLCMAGLGGRRKAKNFQVHAVPCKAMAPTHAAPAAISAPPPVETCHLIDLESPLIEVQSPVSTWLSAPMPQLAPPLPAVSAAPAIAPSAAVAPTATARPSMAKGLFVGGARRSRSPRRATAAFASRAQHRAVGKRLQSRQSIPTVAVPSFEPSSVREQIQRGLRVCPSLCSRCNRESKGIWTREGYGMITGLRTQANEFRAMALIMPDDKEATQRLDVSVSGTCC